MEPLSLIAKMLKYDVLYISFARIWKMKKTGIFIEKNFLMVLKTSLHKLR